VIGSNQLEHFMKYYFYLIILILLSLAPLQIKAQEEDENLVGFVTADSPINLRENPNGAIIASLPPDMSVSILGQSEDGDWLLVELIDGQTGWVSASLMRVMESAIPADLVPISPENAAQLEEISLFASTLSFGLVFSPDGRLLISLAEYIEIYDLRTKILITTLRNHSFGSLDAVFSPDGSKLASAGADGNIILWNTDTWGERSRFSGHTGAVTKLAFSPDGQQLASVGDDDYLIVWDLRTGERLQSIHTNTRYLVDVRFSPDGTLLITGGDSRNSVLIVWDAATGEKLWSIGLAGDLRFTFSPDGRDILIFHGSILHIQAFNLVNGSQSYSFRAGGISGSGWGIDLNPAGTIVAVGFWYGTFLLADIEAKERVFYYNPETPNDYQQVLLDFSPDGRILATTDALQAIHLWGVRG
jgi:WD40 repeat protein